MKERIRIVRGFWAIGGIVLFALGAIGSVLPFLPATPFILLAAFCFARSSDRLDDWFKSTKLYSSIFEGFITKRCMSIKAKLAIVIPITILMGLGLALMGNAPAGRIALAFIWVAHVAYFGFIVKTDRNDGTASTTESNTAVGEEPERTTPRKKHGGMPLVKTELFELLSDAKGYIGLQVMWKTVTLAAQIAIALAAAFLVQSAFESTLDLSTVAPVLATIAAGVAVRAIAGSNETHMAHLASIDVKRLLRGKIYDKLLRLGASYRESTPTSKVVQLAVEGVEQLETYFSLFIPQLFYAFIAPTVLFFALGLLVSWKTAGILLLFIPLIPVSLMVVRTVSKKLLSRYWDQYTRLGDTFLENLQGLTTLKIYQADDQAAARMERDSEEFRKATMNVLKMQLSSTSVMDIGAYCGAAAGMIAALMGLFAGEITVGGCFAVLLLAAEFFLPMRRLGSYFHVGMNGAAASDAIFDLLDLPEHAKGDTRLVRGNGVAFSLDHVSFSYDGERTVLRDVSATFPVGSFTSIVGVSGCGKSTVANLLMGRNRAYEGSLTVNEQQLRDVDESSLMENVTLVSRSSHLFKGSVRDNLLLGNPHADDKALRVALDQVRLLNFVEAQGGLDMPVEEGGTNMSGGQRQRLVLARALLHDTPAYIFDEATSSVDVESEELIMGVVRELARDRTVVLISHRLANVVASDAIFMMQEGRVIEQGTHEELLAVGGAYATLYNHQKELEGLTRKERTSVQKVRDVPNDAISDSLPPKTSAKQLSAPVGEKRASAFSIMGSLVGLVTSMAPIMCLAILLGALGFLCAMFLTVVAGYGVVGGALADSPTLLYSAMIGMAVARGLLHYGEQYCNHFIAFKLLAIVRRKVFAKLRTLAPAKLEKRDKGDLISLITGDIELLEVFYAHTISPIAIALLVSVVMVVFMGTLHWVAGLIALTAYLCLGVALPVWNGRRVSDVGLKHRNAVGALNAYMLDSLYGLDETIQYADGAARSAQIDARSRALSVLGGRANRMQRSQVVLTDLLIQVFSWGMLFVMLILHLNGVISFGGMVVAALAMTGSFGPEVALSNLSITLAGTLASGHRVLQLMEEQPETAERANCAPARFGDVNLDNVSFSYASDQILSNYSLDVPQGSIVGIHGPSGSGKSTVCKLIMRFWDVDKGNVSIGDRDVRAVNTSDLRTMESFVTQDTWLFHESIADNIAIGKRGATRDQIVIAAEKASLRDFIETLPQGIDTMVGELGDTLSDGERQRIGLARAFLHDAPLMLLDEPTSNLDSLNEAVILKSLTQIGANTTIVLVSHRESTMALADSIVEMGVKRPR